MLRTYEIVMFTMMYSTSIVNCVSILITSLSNVTRHDKDAPAVKLALFLWLRFDVQCSLTEECVFGVSMGMCISLSLSPSSLEHPCGGEPRRGNGDN